MSEIIDILTQRLADLSGIEYFTFAFNMASYDLQDEYDIYLSTPQLEKLVES